MNNKKFPVVFLLSFIALVSVKFIYRESNEKKTESVTNKACGSINLLNDNQKVYDASVFINNNAATQKDEIKAEKVLQKPRAASDSKKKEILKELDNLVVQEKSHYESIIGDFNNAIKKYEELSSNFDRLIHENTAAQRLYQVDKILQSQGKKILALEQEANQAYLDLMAKYDKVVPYILTKHF